MWFGLYSDAGCTHELERRQMPKGSTWLEFNTRADRSETYYVKAITQPAGCWADWLARPVSGYDGGCARLAPVTNSYTVTFQRRMEGGGLATISTARVFWHDSATAPAPPAVDGYDAHGAWRQTKGVGGIGALRSVTEDLTYELAYMRRRTVSFVVSSTSSTGANVKTTVHTAKVKYGTTVKSTDGMFNTALQKARERFNVGRDRLVDYAWYWQTTDRVTDATAGSTKFTSKNVTSDLTVYMVIRYSQVWWFCDGTDRAHAVDHTNIVACGTWVTPNATAEARARRPNCTPGWRGWYKSWDARPLHPELDGVATASAFSADAASLAAAADARFAGEYLTPAGLYLYSRNLATTRFAYADGSVHVPEADAHYYPSTVSGEHETAAGTLRLPTPAIRGVEDTLPLRSYRTAYQLLGDGTGRWRTLRPDAWHARADVSDRAFSAMTVRNDSTVYVRWTQVTADGVVDERA